MQVPRLILAGAFLCALTAARAAQDEEPWKPGFDSIAEKDIEGHLWRIAAPRNEGRDSPSQGMKLAGDYIIEVFERSGVEPGWDKGYRHPYTAKPRGGWSLPEPENCKLTVSDGDEASELEFGTDFVPFPGCNGRGTGSVVFLGYGIASKRYNDLGKRSYKGKVAMILWGEPRHKRVLKGPEVSQFADAYAKLEELEERGCSGVLMVRRAPPATAVRSQGKKEPLAPPKLGYRYTWGSWQGTATTGWTRPRARTKIPVAEITEELATRILGKDIVKLAEKIDKAGKSKRIELKKVTVSLSTATTSNEGVLEVDNVFGVLRGTDERLREEYVIIGSHYDHVGVDHWSRIGYGADDNGSGTVANLELVEALAKNPPRRSIVFAFFGSEEDGLIGSHKFAEDLPFLDEDERSPASVVAMLNMDMLGRGDAKECVVLGTRENPALGKVLKKANKLAKTGVKKVTTGKAAELWERSDHYSFHEHDIPVLFFFESASISDNADYHTFRDTIDGLSLPKIANSARLVYATAWLLANADTRPPGPR